MKAYNCINCIIYCTSPASNWNLSISLTDGGVGTQLFNSNTPFEVTANGKSKRKRFLTINRKKQKAKEKEKKERQSQDSHFAVSLFTGPNELSLWRVKNRLVLDKVTQ